MSLQIANKEELAKLKAQYSHLEFIKYCWSKKKPYNVGRHTRTICHLIDEAVEDFKNGKSTFLVVKVHPRAGKSEILSQNLTAHFIGAFPDEEVMICCYNSALAIKNSKLAQKIIRSKKYQELYPNTEIEGGVEQWNIKGHSAMVTASGLISGITGNGYSIGLLDDYVSGRQDAESQVIREKIWDEFTNSFLTRRAPVSITIVLATQWHVDDVIGRIEDAMNPKKKERYQPDFPKFKIVSFPATNGEGDVWVEKTKETKAHWEHQKWDILFPERFTTEFYKQMRASLGDYAFSSLYQCTPQIRGGNFLNTSKVKVHDNIEDFPKTRYYRIWDLAHTEKQTQKDDPDWTSGTLQAWTKIDDAWHLWVKHVARVRAKATERDKLIRSATDRDGQSVAVAVENSLDSKDSVSTLQETLKGKRTVIPINIKIDKIARAGYVEPVFEAGNVHILRDDWNFDWLTEINGFPSMPHDDQVDNITAGFMLCCLGSNGQIVSGKVAGV